MFKMSSQIENIVSAYKTLSKIPSIVSGELNNNGTKITSKWSVRDLDKGKITKYLRSHVLDESLRVVSESDFGIDVSSELLSAVSPSQSFRAVIREQQDKECKKQYLEVWRPAGLAHSIDLGALELHGDVYADSEFGTLEWAPDETALVYVAERKLKKCEPYIKRKPEHKSKHDGGGEPAPSKGEEYVLREDWGEQLVGKHQSVIVVCALPAETLTVLEGLPEGCCPGQVRFAARGRGVVGVAWRTRPRRLGLMFCTNRPGFVFELSLAGQLTRLSDDGAAVRSPRVGPDGAVAWLQRAAGGPHHACHALVVRRGESKVSTIIDIVQTEIPTADGASFYGVYCAALPPRCFSADGGRLLLSTPQRTRMRSYVVDTDGGRIVDISNPCCSGSTSILDARGDVLLASCSSMTTPPQLYVARLPARGAEASIRWAPVGAPAAAPARVAGSSVEHLQLQHEGSSDSVKSFSALYFAPSAPLAPLPLVVWPHGGPHSCFVDAFSLEAALYNMLGFASIQINYRGSTGAGQASVQFLPERVGSADVRDCKLATDEALKKYPIDGKKICLLGGSHGGFLVTHLSGQHPGLYAAVVSRNPVTDIASMFNSSDIADCISVETLPVGLASVRINFRGSTGAGERGVRALLGHAGERDVADCLLAARELRARAPGGAVLCAGSYGGLVAALAAARAPGAFRAAVLRNPLLDLATKGPGSDNSDGCAVEAGFEFSERGPVSEAELLAMRRRSPLAHVHAVRAPTALLLGARDLRVPRHQGLEFARRLRANGVRTRVYMYDDNHSLAAPPHEMDSLINSAGWLLEHLEKSDATDE